MSGISKVLKRQLAPIGVVIVLLVVVAGCGGGGSSSSSTSSGGESSGAETASNSEAGEGATAASPGLTEAEQIVSEHEKAPTEIGVSTPIKKGIPKDKTIAFINEGTEAEINVGRGIEAAAEAVGWKVKTINAEPVPAVLQGAMEEAIRKNPDFIAFVGVNAEEVSRQLEQAKAAGIPVIASHSLQKNGEEGITANVLPVQVAEKYMEVLAAKTAVDVGPEGGEVLVDYLTGFPLPLYYTNAYVSALEKFCPTCTVKKQNIQPTSIGKDAPQQICNQLRTMSNVKGVVLSYDAIGIGIKAACKSAGVTLPPVYTYAPDAPGVEELKNEEKKAGAPLDYGDDGAAYVDTAIRIANGESLDEVEDATADMPIWAAEYGNLPEDPSKLTYIVPNGLEQWEKLWGLK